MTVIRPLDYYLLHFTHQNLEFSVIKPIFIGVESVINTLISNLH